MEFDKDKKTQPVYKGLVLTKDEAEEFAETFFANLGTENDEEQNDFYDETAVFKAKDRYSLWVDYKDGGYRFTDFNTSFPEEPLQVKKDATEQEMREALSAYGVEVPRNAVMKYDSEAEQYVFKITEDAGEKYTNGSISCQYFENGKFSNIDYRGMTGDYYKDFKIISEKEAYDKICKGKFSYPSDEIIEICVKECELVYELDSKGFYQPVYNFVCDINGEENGISIVAIQK